MRSLAAISIGNPYRHRNYQPNASRADLNQTLLSQPLPAKRVVWISGQRPKKQKPINRYGLKKTNQRSESGFCARDRRRPPATLNNP
jgi:hypothetical protein